MAVSVELGKALDTALENATLEEVLAAPPSALAGLTEKHDEILAGMGIKPSAIWGATNTSPSPVCLSLSGKTG